MTPLHEHLKTHAAPHRSKLLDIHIAFVMAIMFLIGWMDHELPSHLLFGHRIVEVLKPTGVFAPIEPEVPKMSVQELVSEEHRREVIEKFMQQPVSKHQDFIVTSCERETLAGWASELLSSQQVSEQFPEGWSPTPAFVVQRF